MSYYESEDPPEGYVYVNAEDHKCRLLLSVVDAAVEMKRREEAMFASAEAERIEREEAAKAKALAKVRERALERKAAEEGFVKDGYEVVLNMSDLERRMGEAEMRMRTPDADVRNRMAEVLKQLSRLGSRRRIARSVCWKDDMAEMRTTFPNFSAPLDMVANTLALSERTGQPLRIPPMLLLGPPGVGKTFFSHRLAAMLLTTHRRIALDQPSAGSQLFGSDSFWGNTQSGILFDLLCMGQFANPLILLDEVDKAARRPADGAADPLSQLHSALERETASKSRDMSTDVEFDASMVTYIGTANSLTGIEPPIISRFEVFHIASPDLRASVDIARAVVDEHLRTLGLLGKLRVEHTALCVLAHLTPRLMHRAIAKAVAASVASDSHMVTEEQLMALCGLAESAAVRH